jgi:lipoprotein-anchoring transpeptidase ErfK/SrfK
MFRVLMSALLALGLVFWISEETAEAKRKRSGYSKQSYVKLVQRKRYKKSSVRKIRSMRRSYGNAVRISVSLGSQSMTVTQGGRTIGNWAISSGKAGFGTPRGTYRVGRMHRTYYSRKYDNAPMPYSMFFRGGFAIHGTGHIRALGRPASHGCIRLHPSNAARLFSLVAANGGIVSIR